MKEKEKVLFDPGYAACTLGISEDAAFLYNAFQVSGVPLKEKKFQFSILFPKIKSLLYRNIAFYLGCLLWAYYITSKDAEIEENPCFGTKYVEKDALQEINYLIDLIEGGLNRDAKYFINKTFTADEKYLPILKAYSEFVVLNKGFVNLKKTKDIVLPKCLKKVKAEDFEKINGCIQEAVKEKDLTKLYDLYDVIL